MAMDAGGMDARLSGHIDKRRLQIEAAVRDYGARSVVDVACCTYAAAEWTVDLLDVVMQRAMDLDLLDWLRYDRAQGRLTSYLGLLPPMRLQIWSDMRLQERRLTWVSMRNARISGHTFRGKTWGGMWASQGWRGDAIAEALMTSGEHWARGEVERQVFEWGRWDPQREQWRGKYMTMEEVLLWLGLTPAT